MSDGDFLPKSDDQLVQWATQFITIASTDATVIGLTAQQVTDFTTKKNEMQTSISTSKTAKDAAMAATATKTTKRRALVSDARALARIVQGKPGVSDQKKRDLGLTVRVKPVTPVKIYAPTKCAVTSISRTVNEVTWEADGNHSGTLYEVYCQAKQEPWQYLTTVTATKLRHTDLVPGATYSYRVRAMRSDVRSDFSNIATLGETGEEFNAPLVMDKAA